jgi:hypothetical protein
MSHDGFKCIECGWSTPEYGVVVCEKCGFCFLLWKDEELKDDSKNDRSK